MAVLENCSGGQKFTDLAGEGEVCLGDSSCQVGDRAPILSIVNLYSPGYQALTENVRRRFYLSYTLDTEPISKTYRPPKDRL